MSIPIGSFRGGLTNILHPHSLVQPVDHLLKRDIVIEFLGAIHYGLQLLAVPSGVILQLVKSARHPSVKVGEHLVLIVIEEGYEHALHALEVEQLNPLN